MFRSQAGKNIILLLAAIALIAGFFLIPPHKKWLSGRLVPYWHDFLKQRNNLDLEQRKQARFGYFYTCCKQIAAPFAARKDKNNILVLMPPTAYFKKAGIKYEVCEPGIFYWLTQVRTVPVTSVNATKANWYVHVKNNKILVDSVTDINSLRDTIAAMKKMAFPL